ncbi:MAG: PAS domain S-box protein [Candidatus Binatia bacterium]
MERLLDGEVPTYSIEKRCIRKDGSFVWINLTVLLVREASGVPKYLISVVEDISARKQAEALRARLVAILEATPDFVGFADAKDTHILYINKAGRRMTGIAENEDVTKLTIADVHPEWTTRMLRDESMPTAIRDGVWTGQCAFRNRDGREIPVLMVLLAHKGEGGQVEVFSTISRDVTELNRAQEEIGARTAELEAVNTELQTFSYSVSHDLQAPLRAIDGFSALLLDRYTEQLDAQAQHYLQRVREGATSMGQLIQALLSLSRVTRAEMQRRGVDLSALAETVAAELRAAEPSRAVEFVIAPGVRAHGDPGLLRAALDNLLRNAWKYTSKHATARIEFGCAKKNGQPVFFVRDDGAGFDMAYVAKLFGAFQRLHAKEEFEGTGIGLATVQRIIHRHGGRVWAEGAVERGATFYFTVPPVAQPPAAALRNATVSPSAS